MSELSELKKQNKQLKALLKNAVQLLNRYKEVLQHASQPQPKKPPRKKSAKKAVARR